MVWFALGSNTCGNGTIEINEECDDNNLSNGDGCSDQCALEFGYTFSSTHSTDNGRIRRGTDAVQANGGQGALTIDTSVEGEYVTNYAIFTIDLSSYTSDSNL